MLSFARISHIYIQSHNTDIARLGLFSFFFLQRCGSQGVETEGPHAEEERDGTEGKRGNEEVSRNNSPGFHVQRKPLPVQWIKMIKNQSTNN